MQTTPGSRAAIPLTWINQSGSRWRHRSAASGFARSDHPTGRPACALRRLTGWRDANMALVDPDQREAVFVVHDEFIPTT
jgi:hypothetical protein